MIMGKSTTEMYIMFQIHEKGLKTEITSKYGLEFCKFN